MATATAAAPEVFVRKSSGLVRVMSPSSAFVYNVLTMGLIFPWTYLWAPGALPGGQLVWGILLAVVLEIPIALAYVWLSTALPRSGGDYVFQSRVLGGGIAFTLVMSGFVIWILQWVALSGWLLAYLGLAPLFLGLGATLGNAGMIELATWFTTANGIIVTSIANALLALLILASGFKNYVRLQRVMGIATLLAFGTMLVVLFTTNAADVPGALNAFSTSIGGSATFYQDAVAATAAAGVDTNPPFSLLATRDIAPVGDLQHAAERRDQGRPLVPQPGHDHRRRARRDRDPARHARLRPRARRRDGVPVRGRCRLLVAGRGGHAQRLLPVAEHPGHRHLGQPTRDPADLGGLHPQQPSDRAQLLYRHDPRDGRDVARPRPAGAGQPRQRPLPHSGQRPRHLLPGQHPGDLAVQPLRGHQRRWVDDLLDVAHAGRDLRLWLRLRRHRTGRRPAALPGQGCLRGLAGLEVHHRGHPNGDDRRRTRLHRRDDLPGPLPDQLAARPDQPAGLHGGWRDPRLLRPLVHRHEDGASLGRHQRGGRVQGDPAG